MKEFSTYLERTREGFQGAIAKPLGRPAGRNTLLRRERRQRAGQGTLTAVRMGYAVCGREGETLTAVRKGYADCRREGVTPETKGEEIAKIRWRPLLRFPDLPYLTLPAPGTILFPGPFRDGCLRLPGSALQGLPELGQSPSGLTPPAGGIGYADCGQDGERRPRTASFPSE